MNIYQMYEHNGNMFNFYVKRSHWATVIAKVISIEGVNEGENIQGKPPYFDNPKVYALYYRVDPWTKEIKNFIDKKQLSCPGSFGYFKVNVIKSPDRSQG